MTQMANPLSLLGKESDSSEVQALLSQTDAKNPKLKKGDIKAWLDLNNMGIALVFTDEGYQTGKDLAIGEGALLLTSITLHSGAHADFSSYTEELPFGVNFSQSQSDLTAVLGNPEKSNTRLRQDRWRINDTWVFAKYTKQLDEVFTLSIQIPDAQ